MGDIEVELLAEVHMPLVEDFDCGIESVNTYLKEFALKYAVIGEAKTHLVIDKKQNKLVGFFAIKCSSIKIEPPLTPHPRLIPSVEISWFGVNAIYQKYGFGKKILAYIIDLINDMKANLLGVRMITLFAIPNVVEFYNKIGFEEATEDVEIFCNPGNEGCIPMFLILPTS